MRMSRLMILAGAICLPLLSIAPAQAQATRTWVSGVGDDANPCSRTAPCKTFAGAISKTAAKGEINCLDPAGFGGLTITKSITVSCTGVEGGVLVSGTNGFIVNVAATDKVELQGLDFEGLSATSLDGIKVIGSGKTFIRNVRINGFNGNGVNVVGTANANVVIVDSFITNNGGGFNVAGAGGVANFGTILHTMIDGNTSFAVQVTGANNSVTVASSVLTNSPAGVSLLSGGVAASFGPSNILTGSGAFAPTLPFK